LIPLLSLHILILSIYIVKLAIIWSLPQGWVAYLVLSTALGGISILALAYPFVGSDQKDNFYTIYQRAFFIILLPLTLLMFTALSLRVQSYGVTEDRYTLAAVGVWFVILSIYFGFLNKKQISFLTQSLLILLLLIRFSPFGAPQISYKNQLARFSILLKKHQEKTYLNFSELKSISSITEYVVQNYGTRPFKEFLSEENYEELTIGSALKEETDSYSVTKKILGYLNLEYKNSWEKENANLAQSFERRSQDSGYNFQFTIDVYSLEFSSDHSVSVMSENKRLKVSVDLEKSVLRIEDLQKHTSSVVNLVTWLEKIKNNGAEDFEYKFQDDFISLHMVVDKIFIEFKNNLSSIKSFQNLKLWIRLRHP
jgi:hypothetical protein